MIPDNDKECFLYLVRSYYRKNLDSPPAYKGMVHTLGGDVYVGLQEIKELLEDVPDRTPIRVTVEILGKAMQEKPRWRYVSPGVYASEDDLEA